MEKIRITVAQWYADGARRFGPDVLSWKFVCPKCGHVAKISAWLDAKAPENTAAVKCVGRFAGIGKSGAPCDYDGQDNPVAFEIDGEVLNVFAFAEA